MRFIYDLLSAIIIVMSVTGLLVDQIKKYQYIVLLVYIMVMVELRDRKSTRLNSSHRT